MISLWGEGDFLGGGGDPRVPPSSLFPPTASSLFQSPGPTTPFLNSPGGMPPSPIGLSSSPQSVALTCSTSPPAASPNLPSLPPAPTFTPSSSAVAAPPLFAPPPSSAPLPSATKRPVYASLPPSLLSTPTTMGMDPAVPTERAEPLPPPPTSSMMPPMPTLPPKTSSPMLPPSSGMFQ